MKQVLKGSFFYGLAFFIIGTAQNGFAQVGGGYGFDFLKIPATARVAALSGVNITSQDEDVNMITANPALLVEAVSRHLSVNYMAYMADIKYSSLAYAHHWEKAGLWGFSLQYMDYGDFEGFDEAGNEAADFSARDYAVSISHSRTVGVFTFGTSLKFAQSYIGSYTATALLLDLGGVFKHPEKALTVGLTLKNMGVMLQGYTDNNTRLPFDVQVGTTFKPEHMPFRFSLTAHNLTKGDIAYYDPATAGNNKEEPGFVDKVFRHLTIGTEILLSKNFNLRAGYNHLIRKELRLDETSGGAGFSMGLMLRIKAFELAYSRRFYHVAGGSNSFTLASDLSTFIKKQENLELDR